MESIDRRSALSLGLVGAFVPLLASSSPASAASASSAQRSPSAPGTPRASPEAIRARAVEEAKRRGVLQQADERAMAVLQNFFRAAGFQKVVIVKSRLG